MALIIKKTKQARGGSRQLFGNTSTKFSKPAPISTVIYNSTKSCNIQPFLHHVCMKKNGELGSRKISLIFAKEEKEKLKMADASCVCKGYRPYQAIECEGMFDLCTAIMHFGQKIRRPK